MRRWMGMPIAAVLVLTACVTINVYFPAAEAKEAAKEFVEKVINEDAQSMPPKSEDDGGGMAWSPATMMRGIDPFSLIGIGTAQAQPQPDITIKTPAIQAIQARMAARFDSKLRVHFNSGALGFTRDGLVVVREVGKLGLKDRVAVNQAVADDNRDRKAVYHEVAVANGHPEWENQIREVFARQWIESARSGWWYQSAGDGWKQK